MNEYVNIKLDIKFNYLFIFMSSLDIKERIISNLENFYKTGYYKEKLGDIYDNLEDGFITYLEEYAIIHLFKLYKDDIIIKILLTDEKNIKELYEKYYNYGINDNIFIKYSINKIKKSIVNNNEYFANEIKECKETSKYSLDLLNNLENSIKILRQMETIEELKNNNEYFANEINNLENSTKILHQMAMETKEHNENINKTIKDMKYTIEELKNNNDYYFITKLDKSNQFFFKSIRELKNENKIFMIINLTIFIFNIYLRFK